MTRREWEESRRRWYVDPEGNEAARLRHWHMIDVANALRAFSTPIDDDDAEPDAAQMRLAA